MNDVLLVFLSLSVSGSVLSLILLAIKPLIKRKLSQTWQYYIWLIVILRFLLPFTTEVTLIGELSNHFQNMFTLSNEAEVKKSANTDGTLLAEMSVNTSKESNQIMQDNGSEASKNPINLNDMISGIWIIWIAVALILLIHKILSYHRFIRFVKESANTAADQHLLDIYNNELDKAKIKRALTLYINDQVVSPMLIGFFRPAIVLPDLDINNDKLRQIFRHELTHFRRSDAIYKWLIQVVICIHWFNPMVYLIRKEINRCCELSCDESVIKSLDIDSRILYGDALIAALNAQGKKHQTVDVFLTMGENADLIKERLDILMVYKKKSRFNVFVTFLLTVLFLCSFSSLGAYASEQQVDKVQSSPSSKTEEANLSEYEKWDVIYKDEILYYGNQKIRLFMDLAADNSFKNFIYNENGSVDVRLIRDRKGSIVKSEYISEEEAAEILMDFDDTSSAATSQTKSDASDKASPKSKKTKEDIIRQTTDELPNDVQKAVASCNDKTWYVLDGQDRRYIYYNGLTQDYAYQYNPDKNSIAITDIGNTAGNYVLLSIPLCSDLKITYHSHSVTYTIVTIS